MLTSLLAAIGVAEAAEWSPGKGPTMTRWAKDVSPDSSHPEYPRPQMVRDDWLNLNGLWQLEMGKADDSPPAGAAQKGGESRTERLSCRSL